MKKGKVLHIVASGTLDIGGVQSIIMTLSRNIPTLQHDVVVFSSEKGYNGKEFQELGGSIYRLPNYEGKNKIKAKLDYYFFRLIRLFFSTYKILKKNGPYNAIHSNNDLESGICNMAAFFAGVKVRISHAHTMNSIVIKGRFLANIYRKVLQKLVTIFSNVKIGCSQAAYYNMFKKFKETKNSKNVIMNNPIDLKDFYKEFNKAKEVKSINIVNVGRYLTNKNQIYLIKMLPYLLKEFSNVKLKLVGYQESYNEYTELLNTKAESLGVSSFIEYLPTHTNVREVLDEAHLFLFPSVKEGFGIALIEAQAMGVPCIASDTVPKDVDLGLCEFISLESGEKIWAERAIELIKDSTNLKLNKQKLQSLDVKEYAKNMESLYLRN